MTNHTGTLLEVRDNARALLKDCEQTRVSGDAGFWEWHEDGDYKKLERSIAKLDALIAAVPECYASNGVIIPSKAAALLHEATKGE